MVKGLIELDERHLLFKTAAQIKEICLPLFTYLGITYFGFMRVYDDGSRCYLSTNPARVKYMCETDFRESSNYDTSEFVSSTGFILWEHGKFLLPELARPILEKKIAEGRNYFNLDNGIAIHQRGPNYFDYYNFGAAPDNHEIVASYLRNLDLLTHFCFYFKDKAFKLIQQASENKNKIIVPKYFLAAEILPNPKIVTKKTFIESLSIKRFHFYYNQKETYVTQKEFNCIKWLASGYTIKQISRQVGLSSKTVNTYIANAQKRLDCNREFLIDLFNQHLRHLLIVDS